MGEVYEGHPALRTGRGVRKEEETENPRADHGSSGVAGGGRRHREVVLRTLKSSPSVTGPGVTEKSGNFRVVPVIFMEAGPVRAETQTGGGSPEGLEVLESGSRAVFELRCSQ